MKKWAALVVLAVAVGGAGVATAHESRAKHGGIVKSAGDLSFELVSKEGKTTIYVDDHGKNLPTAGASGTLTVLRKSAKAQYPLEAGEGNTLVAKGDVKLGAGDKAVAAITFADKRTTSVRFAVK